MRFWFTEVGSSARAFAVRMIETNFAFEPGHSQGGTCSLVPLGGRGEQRYNIVFVPPFPLKFGLCSPVSSK